ncbi:hypothetical protein ACWEQ8_43210, partial [Streptomyces noursei]
PSAPPHGTSPSASAGTSAWAPCWPRPKSRPASEVLNAARGAHYCWNQIADTEQAIENGPELINLLRQLPALDPRHVSTAQTRLQYLHQHPTGRA